MQSHFIDTYTYLFHVDIERKNARKKVKLDTKLQSCKNKEVKQIKKPHLLAQIM